jgi:potassium efflux system protein
MIQANKTLANLLVAISLLVSISTPVWLPAKAMAQTLQPATVDVEEVKPELIRMPDPTADLGAKLEAVEKRLNSVEAELDRSLVSGVRGQHLMDFLRKNRDLALAMRADSETEVSFNRELVNSLGKAPGENDPPEAEDIQQKRTALTTKLVRSQGDLQNSSLLVSRSSALISKISSELTEALRDSLVTTVSSPLSFESLYIAWGASRNLWHKLSISANKWGSKNLSQGRWLSFLAFVLTVSVAGSILILPFRRKFLLLYGPRTLQGQASVDQKVLAIFARGMGSGLIPALAAFAVFVPFRVMQLGNSVFSGVIFALAAGAAGWFFLKGLVTACLMPEYPNWRFWDLENKTVKSLKFWLQIIAGAGSLYLIWALLGRSFLIHGALRDTVTFVLNTVISLSMLAAVRTGVSARRYADQADESGYSIQGVNLDWAWSLLTFCVQVACISIPVFAILGYVALANYLTTRMVITSLILVGFFLSRGLFFFLIERRNKNQKTLSESGNNAGLEEDRSGEQSGSWLLLWAEFGLALIVLVVGLNVWGLSGNNVAGWIDQLAVGITIGDLTFRISDVFIGLSAFLAVLIISRVIVWFVSSRLLSRSNFDSGVRHALRSGLSYVGVFVAIFVAVSAVGLDMSKLAIVAGALSLGIGFGLQAIVSNFVSGIILLFERPIKIGDWVQVGSVEGTVRRINVRSTEIETFQRATVFVPNSSFISSNVINWTANNKLGRLDLPISVAYGSDTKEIHDLLVEIAKQQPMVRVYPEPAVYFRAFGGSSLDFELRVFLRDVNYVTVVKSELLFAIDKCFRDRGIEVPFATTDINIRSMPGLETAKPKEEDKSDD